MKNKFTLLASIAVVGLIALVSGTTYAFWKIDKSQTNTNVINSSCLNMTMDSQLNDINLQNAFPISDNDGLNSTAFTFTITNKCTSSAHYTVYLEMLNGTDLKSDYVKVSFNEKGSAKGTPTKLSSYSQYQTLKISGTKEGRTLISGVQLAASGTKSYELRLWMDGAITVANNDAMNKTYKSKIVIEGAKTA